MTDSHRSRLPRTTVLGLMASLLAVNGHGKAAWLYVDELMSWLQLYTMMGQN